jgi:transitional endoplasmic reticulum ATPase
VLSVHNIKKFFPSHTLVSSADYNLNILGFPEAQSTPLKDHPLITSTLFFNLARVSAPVPGMLIDRVQIGAFNTAWQVTLVDYSIWSNNDI